jgi:GNAT superfamily N-acetyltransferase
MAIAADVEIRVLRPGDAPRVADLLAVAFAEEFEGAGAEVQGLHRQLRAGGWAQREPFRSLAALFGVEFAFFVAEHRGQIVGCVGVIGQALPLINSVAVHPNFRRLGIAEALMREAETFIRSHGHDTVVLDVLEHNTPARALYQKLGYEEYHRYRTYARDLMPGPSAPPLPEGYDLVPVRPPHADAFPAIERASLPEGYRTVTPSLAPRYVSGPPALLQRLLGGSHTSRRVLIHQGAPAGYLLAHLAAGQHEGRIEYPLIPPEHNHALPGALAETGRFLIRHGASIIRIDLPATRADQHEAVTALGFTHRWTFVQMRKRLSRSTRIPVRASDERTR